MEGIGAQILHDTSATQLPSIQANCQVSDHHSMEIPQFCRNPLQVWHHGMARDWEILADKPGAPWHWVEVQSCVLVTNRVLHLASIEAAKLPWSCLGAKNAAGLGLTWCGVCAYSFHKGSSTGCTLPLFQFVVAFWLS